MNNSTNSDKAVSNINDAKDVIGGQVVGTENTTGKYAVGKGTINIFNQPADAGSGVSDSSTSHLHKKNIVQKPVIFRGEKPTFVGRLEYIDQIREYLKTPGVRLSLVGLGGTGKSALAYRAIHRSEDLFDSIIPIYFDSNLTLDEFLLKIAENLKDIQLEDFRKEGVDKRIEILMNVLGKRNNNNSRTLILADNYETISGVLNNYYRNVNSNDYNNDNSSSRPETPKDDLVKINDFLNSIPTDSNTSIIVTSRERERNLDGETKIEIGGLSIDEGSELFVELANDKHIKQSHDMQKAIEQDVVEKTGGHPLSIEILARSYRGLGIKEIRNMSETLGLGAVNPRQPEERLKSLKSSFDYSLGTLDEDLRGLLYKLIFFFSSPFPLSAVTEIFGATEISVVNLYGHSLLERIESDEYGDLEPDYYLYNFRPALRNYLGKSTSSEFDSHKLEEEFAYLYCEYYRKFVVDLEAAMNKGQANPSYIRCFNIMVEGESNDFERAMELSKDWYHYDGDFSLYSFVISEQIGLILHYQSSYIKAKYYFEKSKTAAEGSTNKEALAEAYANMALVLDGLGQKNEAIEQSKKALSAYEGINAMESVATVYNNLGTYVAGLGDSNNAIEYHKKALEIAGKINQKEEIANAYANLGNVFFEMNRYEEALENSKKALQIYEELGNNRRLATIYNNISAQLGNSLDEAMKYAKKALEIAGKINQKEEIATAYVNIATILLGWDRTEEALENSKKALQIYEELGNISRCALIYDNMGVFLHRLKKNEEAMEYHKKSLEILEQSEFRDLVEIARNHYNIAYLFMDTGKHKESGDAATKAIKILKEYEEETGIHHPYIDELQQAVLTSATTSP